MAQGTFATAVNCMDGRTQKPVTKYLKVRHNVDFVDAITEPGPIRILAEHPEDMRTESIKTRLDISINGHGSKVVAVVGHHDCAGNPVDRKTQERQLHQAVHVIQTWFPVVTVCGVYVDEDWEVNLID